MERHIRCFSRRATIPHSPSGVCCLRECRSISDCGCPELEPWIVEELKQGSIPAWYSSAVDVERTIEALSQRQLKAEARADAMEKRLDRRMDAITKLVQQGMRMLVGWGEAQKETDRRLKDLAQAQKETDRRLKRFADATERSLKELAEAQKATDRTLRAFINSLRDGRNGH